LEKIMNNLLSNAFKFTPVGGRIRIEVQRLTSADQLQVKVQDNGRGIPKEALGNIFKRFYQVDTSFTRDQQGTGIGLSLTKELIEFQGGAISAESQVGLGTKFVFRLPLQSRSLKAAVKTPQEEERHSTKTRQIGKTQVFPGKAGANKSTKTDSTQPILLIVEDNPELRSHIHELFDHEYQVLEAANGVEGFEMATVHLPDLVISDLMMPEMDGLEFCTRLKADVRSRHIPVILLTALTDVESRLNGLKTGADDYLGKPFHTTELAVRVSNLIEQRQKLRTLFSKEVKLQASDVALSSLDEQFIHRLIEIIEQNMDDPELSVQKLGEEAGLSRIQLYRKIKALTDLTPSEFLRSIRLKRAAQMLTQQTGTVAEVMHQVGFSNSSYFAKCFRAQFELSPLEYQRKASVSNDAVAYQAKKKLRQRHTT